MRLKQTADFSVSFSQDTKSIKDLPQGVDSLTEEKKQSILKSLVGQLLYLDLTLPDLAFLISDLSRSSSKTSDEILRVARALLKKVRELAKRIFYLKENLCYLKELYRLFRSSRSHWLYWLTHNLADPLTKRIRDHDIMNNVMTSRPIQS